MSLQTRYRVVGQRLMVIMLLALTGAQPALATSSAYVANTILVSTTTISSTQTDYKYKVRVVNSGAALLNAAAYVSSRSAYSRVTDNEILLGNLARGSTTTSIDTVTVRRSRAGAPDPRDLSWDVDGQEANSAPVANAGPDQTVRIGALVTLDGTASTDADGEPLYYRWSLVSKPTGSAAKLSSSTVARPTFTVDKRGAYVFRLSVSDSATDFDERGGHCRGDEVRISTVNSAPTANAGADRTVPRASTVALDGTASSDPDLDSILYAWTIVAKPTGSTALLSSSTASRPTITLDKPGSYRFSLTVSDSQSASSPDEVVITTDNSVPVADAGADQQARIGIPVTLNGSASRDADNDPLSFAWTWTSGPTGTGAILRNADLALANFTPDLAGLYVVQLIVNDGFANSTPDTTTVTIDVPVNRPPLAGSDSATTPQDTPVTINVLANDSDPDAGTTLTIASFAQPATGGTVAAVAGGLRFTPTAGFSGIASFTYVVSDGQLTATGSVNVTVTPVVSNRAPTVNAGADRVAASSRFQPTATILLAGAVSDDGLPNPAQLSIGWSKLSGPGAVTFSAASSAVNSATFDVLGTYVLRLSASDGLLSAADDMQVIVQVPVNTGPALNAIGNRTQAVGNALSLQFTANDNDLLDTLTYSAIAAPAGSTTTAQGRLTWTPTAAQLGPQAFTISVHDAAGLSDSKSFVVTVVNQNHAPVLGALSNDTSAVGANYSKTINASDADGDTLSFDLLDGPAGMSIAGAVLSWQPGAPQTGDFTVKVRVRDAAGAAAVGLFKISVAVAGAPIAHDDTYNLKLGETLNIAAPGVLGNDFDPNGSALTSIKRSDPAIGTLGAFGANGSFTYTAPATNPKPPFTIVGSLISNAAINRNPSGLAPALADLNQDGKPDLVYFGYAGPTLVATALSGGDGHALWSDIGGLDANFCENNIGNYPGYALGDIADSGQIELVTVTGCRSGESGYQRLAAFRSDGSRKWVSPLLTKELLDVHCAIGGCAAGAVPTRTDYSVLFEGSLSLARLSAGEAPVIMARAEIPATAGEVYTELSPGVLGYKDYGCRIVTGDAADMGQACDVTMLMSGTDGSVLQVLRSPLKPQFNRGIPIAPFMHSPPIAADLDGDGNVEIVSGPDVWKRVGNSWTLAWQGAAEPEQVAVADLDGDGHQEVIWALDRNQQLLDGTPYLGFVGILIFDANGQELRRIPLPNRIPGMMTIADVDGDRTPEILIMEAGNLHAIGIDGSYKWTYIVPDNPLYPQAAGFRTSYRNNVVVYDLDGDGNNEVIFSSAAGLHILDGHTGNQQAFYAAGTRYAGIAASNTTFVTDWDNDGHADIISFGEVGGYATESFAYLVKAANNDWLPAAKIHNQVAFQPTGVNEAGRILFDPSVSRSYRNPIQLGSVRDPRETAGTAFSYVANNGTADSSIAKVFLAIAPQNSPPVFTSRPPTVMQASGPSPFVYQPTVVDPDVGDTIMWSINVSGTNGITGEPYVIQDAVTGAVSMVRSAAFGRFGLRITLTATDSQGASTTQTFVVQHETAAPATVPNVVGSALSVATATLSSAALQSVVLQEQFSAQPVGAVTAQNPVAGSTQPLGTVVLLTVSKGLAPVFVPNVVGKSGSSATSALTTSGFTVSITRVYSSTVPAGRIISQSPTAGSQTVPGPATVTISLGSGLNVHLSRDYTNANLPIAVSVFAVGVNAVETSFIGASLSITTAGVNTGSIPTVSGLTITPAANTQGTYRVTATDVANGRVGTADFVVTAPADASSNVEAAAFAAFSEAITDVVNLMTAAQTAGNQGDQATMVARTQEAVTRWRAFDQSTLRLSSPYSPPSGMPPRLSDMAGFGVTPIADDALNVHALENGVAAVEAMILGLRNTNTPFAQLRNLLDAVSSAIEPLPSLHPGEYGLVQAQAEHAYLASILIPNWMDALTSDLAHATGLPAVANYNVSGTGLAGQSHSLVAANVSSNVYVFSTLAEQLTTLAVNTSLEELNVLQLFQKGIMQQATSGALLVGLASHLRGSLHAEPLEAVVAGASTSILRFRTPYSMIEGLDFEEKYPIQNDVVFLGPDTVSLVSDILDAVRTGVFSNTADATKLLSALYGKLKAFVVSGTNPLDPLGNVNGALGAGSQPTHDASHPCIFAPDPSCVELLYPSGFYSVYNMDPLLNVSLPPQLAGLPVPTIVIARNRHGQFYLATPSFIPYRGE